MNWNSPQIPEFYIEKPPGWAEITRDHTYDDKSKSFNEVNSTAARTWELHYAPIDRDTDGAGMLSHYNTYRLANPFSFVAKSGVTYTNVYYQSFDIEPAMSPERSDVQRIKIVLIKYP